MRGVCAILGGDFQSTLRCPALFASHFHIFEIGMLLGVITVGHVVVVISCLCVHLVIPVHAVVR